MAEQRIAGSYQASPIPIPQGQKSPVVDGFDVIADAAGKMDAQDRQTDQQVAAIDHRLALAQQQEEDSALAATQGAAFAQLQSRVALKTEELRNAAPAGAVGYETQVRQMVDEELRQFDAGFGNNGRVRQRFIPNVADFQGRTESREGIWAIDTRNKQVGAAVDAMTQEQGNAIARDPSIDNYVSAIALARTTIGKDVSPSLQDAAMKIVVTKYTGSLVDGLLATGRQADVKVLLEKGFFDDKVADVDRIRQRVGAAEDAATRDAELAQGRAQQAVQDQAKLIDAKVKAGIIPTSAEIASVRSAAQTVGLKPDEVFDLALTEARIAVTRQYQGRDVVTMQRDSDALHAKIDGGTATDGDQVAARQLDDLIDARQKQDAERYKGLLAQGTQGRIQIAQDLQRLPADLRWQQGEKIERGLGAIANLPTADARTLALNGREQRKADTKLTPAKDVDAAFKGAIGRASLGWAGEALNGVREVAADIYAGAAKQTGHGETFDAGLYRNSLNVALGRTRRRDGTHQGGLGAWGGTPVILPDTKTQDEFAGILQRHDFGGATYGNGVAARKNDVLRRYLPVYMGELPDGRTRYRFVDPGGRELTGKGGGTYVIEIRR